MKIQQFNHTGINWGVETDDFPYKKLADLRKEKTYPLLGCFVTPDNGYGAGAVLITSDALINIPQRYVETIMQIRNDPECVEEIKSGKVGFHYVTFRNPKYKNEGYSLVFDELK